MNSSEFVLLSYDIVLLNVFVCDLWIFLVPKNNATRFTWLSLVIHAYAYMHPYPNIPQ